MQLLVLRASLPLPRLLSYEAPSNPPVRLTARPLARPPARPLQNWLRFADNKLGGTVPASWAATSPHLSQLTLDENVPGFSGNLYMLAQHSMINFNAANNPQMVRGWVVVVVEGGREVQKGRGGRTCGRGLFVCLKC